MSQKSLLFALFSSATIVISAATARANPAGMYGLGARSAGLGSAVSADVEDFSATYYNPAGLVRGNALRLELGYLYADHHLTSNGNDNHVDPVHGISGGIVAPGRIFGLRFAFGLALSLPDDRLSRSRSLPQAQPRWELYDNRVQILYIAANLAIAPFPWLRIGGGLAFLSSTQGNLAIGGDIGFTNSHLTDLHHSVDADLVAVRYPQGGIQVDIRHDLTLALVYRGEASVRLGLDAVLDGRIIVGRVSDPNSVVTGRYVLSSDSVSVFLPQQAVLGAAWRPTSDVTIMADVTWVNWAAYPNPASHLQVSLNLNIPPGLSAVQAPNIPAPVPVAPANFHDTVVPRVGAEWRIPLGVDVVALRAGYRFDPTPVPNQGGVTNFMDSNRHVVSVGAGFTLRGLAPVLPGGIHFDAYGDMQFLENRTVLKDDPTDPIGDYVLGGYVVTLGGTVGVSY